MDKVKVILDTNFLLSPARIKIDIFKSLKELMNEPYEIFVLDKSIEELKNLANLKKNRVFVDVALKLVKDYNVKVIKTKSFLNTHKLHEVEDADDLIVELVSQNPQEYVVATQDKELKRRLKELGVRRIIIRKKSFLEFER